jgi:hypothetical protein
MTAALRWLAWARWPLAIGMLTVFAVHEGFRQAGVALALVKRLRIK